MGATKTLSITTAGLVALISAGSFTLSYNALRLFALANGIPGNLAYIWPLLVDCSLIVFSLSVVNAHLHAQSAAKQWVLVALYTLATIAFNCLHAPDNLTARIVAAIAPVSLFFSFELLMGQLKASVIRSKLTANVTELTRQVSARRQDLTELEKTIQSKTAKIEKLNTDIDSLTAKVTAIDTSKPAFIPGDKDALQKANDTRQAQIEERRGRVLILAQQGKSQSEIAGALDISLATVKRDVKTLNGSLRGGQ